MSFPDIVPDLKTRMPELRGRLLANQSLAELYKSQRATFQEVMGHSLDPEDLRRLLQRQLAPAQ